MAEASVTSSLEVTPSPLKLVSVKKKKKKKATSQNYQHIYQVPTARKALC